MTPHKVLWKTDGVDIPGTKTHLTVYQHRCWTPAWPYTMHADGGAEWRKNAATVSCEAGSSEERVSDSEAIDMALEFACGKFALPRYYTCHV